MGFRRKNILERINEIDEQDLQYIESDLSFYQLVSISFLLYGDITSAREFILQKLIVLSQHPPQGKGFREITEKLAGSDILRDYVKLNPDTWRLHMVEAFAIIRAKRMLRKLGLPWQEVYHHFLPLVAEISVHIHPLLKALYKISERLTPDQAGRLIKYVNTAHSNCRHLRFNDSLYLEIFILNWLTKHAIAIGNKQLEDCDVQILIEFFKFSDMDLTKDILLETINQRLNKEPSSALNNLTSSNNLNINDSGITMSRLSNADGNSEEIPNITDDYDAAERYKLGKENAGYILIINQYKFCEETNPKFKHLLPKRKFKFIRNGTDFDRDRLKEVFSLYGYIPLVFNNLTHLEILHQIRETVNKSLLKDSLIICILSHGREGVVYGSNCIPVAIPDIKEILTAKTLRGKPKMIFIQACQKYDPKVNTTSTEVIQKFDPNAYADMLLANSSIKGTESMRDPDHGSWFIQSICDLVQKYGSQKHMLDILTAVINDISKKGTIARDEVMLPEISTTLRKELYLPS